MDLDDAKFPSITTTASPVPGAVRLEDRMVHLRAKPVTDLVRVDGAKLVIKNIDRITSMRACMKRSLQAAGFFERVHMESEARTHRHKAAEFIDEVRAMGDCTPYPHAPFENDNEYIWKRWQADLLVTLDTFGVVSGT